VKVVQHSAKSWLKGFPIGLDACAEQHDNHARHGGNHDLSEDVTLLVGFGKVEFHGGVLVHFDLALVNDLVSFVEVLVKKIPDHRFSGIDVLLGVECVGGGKVEQHSQVFLAVIIVSGGIGADSAFSYALPSFWHRKLEAALQIGGGHKREDLTASRTGSEQKNRDNAKNPALMEQFHMQNCNRK